MCSEAHQRDPRNANVLRDRAEAFILNQEYEKGTGATAANEGTGSGLTSETRLNEQDEAWLRSETGSGLISVTRCALTSKTRRALTSKSRLN